jgi:hypothetical protein
MGTVRMRAEVLTAIRNEPLLIFCTNLDDLHLYNSLLGRVIILESFTKDLEDEEEHEAG